MDNTKCKALRNTGQYRFWPINTEKTLRHVQNNNKKNLIWYFQVLHCKYHSHMALHLLLTVFSHAQHDTSECVGPQISVQAEHHSLSEFQRHSLYFQHCQYKTSASCLSSSNKRIKHMNKRMITDWKLWRLWFYVPTYSSVSALNGIALLI